jgi:signal transduction histidine kinase
MNTILIIEDEKILRETLTDILEINGYNVLQAKDGEEGVEIYTQTAPDLIICDINMPKMNGFEVLHMLEVIMPVSQFPPFIFQSAKTEPENIRKGMNLGATDFITKPYSAPELLKVIKLRLQKRKKLHLAIIKDERIRIAKELHKNVQLLTTATKDDVKIVGDCLNEIPKENQSSLKNSEQLFHQAISSIQSLLCKLENDVIKINELENYLNIIFNTLRSTSDVKFNLTINLEGVQLSYQLQIYICLMVREMIENALKHAKAKTVSLKIIRKKKDIQLTFHDDGIGFNANGPITGSGLQNIRKKITELNGKMILESEPNKGTRIQLTL